ncbi:hypothetical protein C1A50_4478 [Paenibacillus polymyxa]|nr:hypothetical protein C1A50_4478 [Paenibacillus polymyxa]
MNDKSGLFLYCNDSFIYCNWNEYMFEHVLILFLLGSAVLRIITIGPADLL